MNNLYSTLAICLIFTGCTTKEVCKSPELLDLNNDTMSLIKGGEFLMGEYSDKFGDKKPKEVYVSSFYLDRTEVTNGVYKAYIDEKECGVRRPTYIDDEVLGADELPVVDVTHKEAKEFCKFYGKRLPTEAEWEYAARGGEDFKKFPWGNDESLDYMNFRESNIFWSVPVKTYIPNTYLLFDMAGNVREWVEDSYEKDFYTSSCLKSPIKPLKDYTIGKFTNFDSSEFYKSECYYNPVNKNPNISLKVNRGGSWEYSEGYPPTVSFRFFDDENSSNRDLGFRCAHDAKKEVWVVKKIREFKDELE